MKSNGIDKEIITELKRMNQYLIDLIDYLEPNDYKPKHAKGMKHEKRKTDKTNSKKNTNK